MIVSIAAAALAVQFSMTPGSAVAPDLVAPVLPQNVQYRVPVHPPPCGHGWDLSARDGMCYPNGYLPPQDQAARQYQRHYGGGRYPARRADTTIGTEASGRLGWHPPNVRPPERYGRRSSATASATTATSEAMVYGFGSHPSGA